MSDGVQFDTESDLSIRPAERVKKKSLTELLVMGKTGPIQNEKQAQQVVVFSSLLMILLAGWLFVSGTQGPERLTNQQVQQIIQNQQGAQAPR